MSASERTGLDELARLIRTAIGAASAASWAEGRYVYGAPGLSARERQRQWHRERDAAQEAQRQLWTDFHRTAAELRQLRDDLGDTDLAELDGAAAVRFWTRLDAILGAKGVEL